MNLLIGDELLKTFKRVSYFAVLLLFLLVLLPASAFADIEPIEGAELSVISENSGYKIIVPNYIGLKTVERYDDFYEETFEYIVVEKGMPEKDEEGNSLIFQVVTTDSEATALESYPGNAYEQLGFVQGEIINGRFNYTVSFNLEEDEIYSMDFFTDSGFAVGGLNFMFISSDAGESEVVPSVERTESSESIETAPSTESTSTNETVEPVETAPSVESTDSIEATPTPTRAEFTIGDEASGYQIIIPSFIEKSSTYISYGLSGEREDFDLYVMTMPEPNSDGNYPLFQLTTTDSSATSVEVKFADEYIIYGTATGEFVDGTFDIAFTIDEEYADVLEVYEGFEYFIYITTDSGFSTNFAVKFVSSPEASDNSGQEQTVLAVPTSSTVLVNGEEVAFDAYVINSNNYFKLRDLAHVVSGTEKQFEVSWDGANNTISLESGKAYTPVGGELTVAESRSELQVQANASKILVDGTEVEFTAYTINGNNYFKLRDLARTFNIGVSWDGTTNTVGIDTTADYVE